MTTSLEAPPGTAPPVAPVGKDTPTRRPGLSPASAVEMGGSLVAALATIWVIFALASIKAPFGMGVATFLLFLCVYGVLCWRLHGVLYMKDRLALVTVWSVSLAALVPLVSVILFVIIKGAPVALADFPHFFYTDMSQLSPTGSVTQVGVGAAIVGTVEQVGIAMILAVPLGILCATFLVESRSVYARFVGNVVDAMTGAPAIIFGLFVYLTWVAPHKTNGKSGFAAALALTVMMLPIVTRTSQEVITIVPGSLREAAAALGAPRWRILVRVVLPTARIGLATAVILGVARIAGETAPILFNAGGNNHYNWNPFKGQQDNLPLRVYELIFQPSASAIRLAWGASFVLVLLVLIIFVIGRIIGASGPGKRRLPISFMRRSGGSSDAG